jgi:hypothetical protein
VLEKRLRGRELLVKQPGGLAFGRDPLKKLALGVCHLGRQQILTLDPDCTMRICSAA